MGRSTIRIDTAAGFPAESPVRLDIATCLRLASRGYECAACQAACPIGVLSFQGASLSIGDACTACGRCATACPTEALVVSGFEPLPELAPSIAVECRRVPAALRVRGSLAVPCLGGLSVNLLLALFDATDRRIDLVDRGWCPTCAMAGSNGCSWMAIVAEAATLLDLAEVPGPDLPRVLSLPAPEAQALPAQAVAGAKAGRRGLFATLRDKMTGKVAPQPTRQTFADGTCAAARPRRLRSRLELMARIAARPGRRLPAGLLPRVSIGPECDHSGICAALCPTAALRRYDGGSRAGLVFHAEDCIACGRCVTACPNHAIAMTPTGHTVFGGTTVSAHALAECRCGARYPVRDGISSCSRCRKSQALMHSAAALMGRAAQDGENADDSGENKGEVSNDIRLLHQ